MTRRALELERPTRHAAPSGRRVRRSSSRRAGRRRRGRRSSSSPRARRARSSSRERASATCRACDGARSPCRRGRPGAASDARRRPLSSSVDGAPLRSRRLGRRRAALHRARRAPRPARRPRRPRDPARRRPRLHRARLPARHARRRRHPAGRLRAGAVAAVLARLRGVDRRPRQRHALRPRRRRSCVSARAPPARCALHCSPHADARRAPARATCAPTGLPRAAARVGLRLLEEPRRLRAPARRRGRRRRLPPARHPARRDRARLAVGDAIQHVGVQPAPVPGLDGDGRALARRGRAHRRVGHAVGEPRVASTASTRPTRRPRALHARAGARTTPRAGRGTSSATPTASRTSRAGGWAPARRSTSPSPAAEAWWREQAKRVLRARRRGHQGRRRRGLLLPRRRALRRRHDRRAGRVGRTALLLPALDAARARRGPPRRGRAVRARRAGPASRPSGCMWGGDQASDFWSLRTLVCGDAHRGRVAASRTGRTTSAATSASGSSTRCPKELLCAGSSSAASRR